MLVSDFHFELPEELIAQHPPAERGASRMLVLDRSQAPGARDQGAATAEAGWFRDARFSELPEFLRAGDLLVLNDSRVLPARLFATRVGLTTQAGSPAPSGVVEVLLTEEDEPLVWRALVKPAKKVRVGERLEFYELDSAGRTKGPGLKPATDPVLTAEVVGVGEFGERTLRFGAVEDFYSVVGRIGHMPLPPYIRRPGAKALGYQPAANPDFEVEDRERYQTVYSHEVGSAAAPTAGLHFTPEVLAELKVRGVEVATVTLHVGLGTFQPVRVSELKDIRLHAERYTLPAATAEALTRALAAGRRVVAVGTTTTRTLEHIAMRAEQEHVSGAKAPVDLGPGNTEVPAYQGPRNSATAEAPRSLRFEAHSGSTSIFIGPGHRFRVVSGLLTNFHLPESTLLMLVAAFAGAGDEGRRRVLAAYAHAVREGYRFYSYGDCMLVV